MFNKCFRLIFLIIFNIIVTSSACAAILVNNKFNKHFYAGVTAGYGQTTWGYLVPEELNAAMNLSTPIHVSEGGAVWGVYGGYEITPYIAIEASYMRYPDADLEFDPDSLFTFYHEGRTEFNTQTEDVSLSAKIMLPLGCTSLRMYSSVGVAGVHRYDEVADRWRISPSFGAGFNYVFHPNLMLELGMEYVAGYGQSEIEPAEHYIPFLYSGFLRLAYRFG